MSTFSAAGPSTVLNRSRSRAATRTIAAGVFFVGACLVTSTVLTEVFHCKNSSLSSSPSAFVAVAPRSARNPHLMLRRESQQQQGDQELPSQLRTEKIEKASTASGVTALVAITPANARTAAAVAGGAAGLLMASGLVGTVLGSVLFASTSYATKKTDSDGAQFLELIGRNCLRAFNFGAYLFDKYECSAAIDAALEDVSENVQAQFAHTIDGETKRTLQGVGESMRETVDTFNKEVDLIPTIGGVVEAASQFAAGAIDELLRLQRKKKITEKIAEAWNWAVAQVMGRSYVGSSRQR